MKRFLMPLVAFGSGLATIALILAFASNDPASALVSFFERPFSSRWYVGNMLDLASLLMIAGTGSALAIKGGTFNLGGESQLYASALVTALLLSAPATGAGPASAQAAAPFAPLIILGALAAATLTGALIGFIPGMLRAKLRTNELIVSFLLSAALVPALDYLVAGPFRDAKGSLIATAPISIAYRLPRLLSPSTLNPSFAVACVLAALAWAFLYRSATGRRYALSGSAPEFARFAGYRSDAVTVGSMALSGALHGIAGFFAVAGTWLTCHQSMTAGLGWSALAVALIARANPAAVIPAALLYAWLETASDSALLSTQTPFDSTSLVQAVVFLVVSARYFRAKGGAR
jgi:riboflavin transport system permease protein